MAGIGFELKKMFNKKGIINTLRGVAYSTITTIGPLVMIILTIISINIIFDYNSLPYVERDLMSSAILYVFIFSLLVTAPFTAVLSRFIADKIYEKDIKGIMPSYYVGVSLSAIVGALIGIPFFLKGVYVGDIDPIFMGLAYLMFIQLCMVFIAMSYISVLKEFRRIAVTFFVGMVIVFGVTAILVWLCKMSLTIAILYAFNLGYGYIGFRLYTLLRLFLPAATGGYGEVFHYFTRHKALFLANFLYILGMYTHNFVFWGSPLAINVSDTFVVAPAYDLANCLGMFTNISFMVAFVVQIETNFYDKYNTYCHMLVGGNKSDIDKAKSIMFYDLTNRIVNVVKLQALFTFCVVLLSYVLFPIFGIGGMVASIYPTLAVAYLAVFVSYSFIVTLYYFNDELFAAVSGGVFAAATLVGAYFAKSLVPELYGVGVFFGALCGFTVSVLRLRYLYNHLDEHIYCRGRIVDTVVVKRLKKRDGKNERNIRKRA